LLVQAALNRSKTPSTAINRFRRDITPQGLSIYDFRLSIDNSDLIRR
jgi:hypothetical protein